MSIIDRKSYGLGVRRQLGLTCFVWMSLCFLATVTVARALVVVAQDDEWIRDVAKNGNPNEIHGGPEIQVTQSASVISAGVFEFKVGDIPAGASVADVILQLWAVDLGAGVPNPPLIVRGYEGDGNVELADFNAGVQVGGFVPRLGLNLIQLPVAVVQDVIEAGGQFVGVVVTENINPATLDFTFVDFASTDQGALMRPTLVINLDIDLEGLRQLKEPSFSIVEPAALNIRNLLGANGAPAPFADRYQEDTVLGPPSPTAPFSGCCGFPFPPRLRLLGVPLPAGGGNPDTDVNGISFGRPEGLAFAALDLMAFFSVGPGTEGIDDTDVALEAAAPAQTLSDIFFTDLPGPVDLLGAGDNKQVWDGNGARSAPGVGPSPGLGLLENAHGGLDALDMRAAKQDPDRSIFWTVTTATVNNQNGPLEPFAGRSGADVFVSSMDDHYPAGAPVVYAAAEQLELNRWYDDIDALVVADDGARDKLGNLFFDPAQDLVYFSLTRGSRTQVDRGLSPADVFSSGLGQGLNVFLPANMLGLEKDDELDALDLVPRWAGAEPIAGSE